MTGLWVFVFSVMCLGLTVLGLHHITSVYRRYRYVEDLPTSTARAAAVGLTEVNGKVKAAEESFLSPFQEKPCVLCHYAFYGRRASAAEWVSPKETGTLGVPFYVEDDTGRILVRPMGAEIKLPCHLTELTVDADRIEELSPAVAERFKERTRNGSLPDISGGRAEVANAVYALSKGSEGVPRGPSCGAEARLEEGEEVYVIGHAQPMESDADADRSPNLSAANMLIGRFPETEGAFARFLGMIPYLSSGYGSMFEIYAGREEDLLDEHRTEMWKGAGVGFLLLLLGLLSLLVLLKG